MGLTTLLFVLFGFSSTPLVTSVEYQPIKIIVNENFNAIPTQQFQGLPSLTPQFVQQGAIFFFNPDIQLPLGLTPPHIEASITSVQHKNKSIKIEDKPELVDEEKIIEVISPIKPMSETSIQDNVFETIKISELPVMKPVELTAVPVLPAPSPIGSLADLPVLKPFQLLPKVHTSRPIEFLAELPVSEPIGVIVEEKFNAPPLPIPCPINDEPETTIQELTPIPEAPKLPPLSLDFIFPVITSKIRTPQPVIPTGPVVQPIVGKISYPKPHIEEIVTVQENIIPVVVSKPQKVLFDSADTAIFKEVNIFETSEVARKPHRLLPNNRKHNILLVPFSKFNVVDEPKLDKSDNIMISTSRAHDIVTERTTPSILIRGRSPKVLKLISSSIKN